MNADIHVTGGSDADENNVLKRFCEDKYFCWSPISHHLFRLRVLRYPYYLASRGNFYPNCSMEK